MKSRICHHEIDVFSLILFHGFVLNCCYILSVNQMIRLAKCLDRINGYVPKELREHLIMYQGFTTMIATKIDILEYSLPKQFPHNVFFFEC